jgi:hypothetical protein
MPTKRRFIIFLIVLAIMLLIKRAVGQESAAIGWDPSSISSTPFAWSLDDNIIYAIVWGVVFGTIFGLFRVAARSLAAQHGNCFTGDLVLLRLQS